MTGPPRTAFVDEQVHVLEIPCKLRYNGLVNFVVGPVISISYDYFRYNIATMISVTATHSYKQSSKSSNAVSSSSSVASSGSGTYEGSSGSSAYISSSGSDSSSLWHSVEDAKKSFRRVH